MSKPKHFIIENDGSPLFYECLAEFNRLSGKNYTGMQTYYAKYYNKGYTSFNKFPVTTELKILPLEEFKEHFITQKNKVK